MDFTKSDEFENRPVMVSWRLSENDSNVFGSTNIDSLVKTDVVVINDLSLVRDQTFLYIDIDGWPRRRTLVWNGQAFTEPNADENTRYPNADFANPRLTAEKPKKNTVYEPRIPTG